MSAVAAAIGVGAAASLASGAIAASGAKKASNAQLQASREAEAANKAALERQIGLQEPFRQAGLTAQDKLMRLLGLGTPGTEGGAADWDQYLTANPDVRQAYDAGVDKNQFPTPQSFAQWHYQTYGKSEGRPVPSAPAPATGEEFGKYARDFSMADFEQDPGYAFRRDEGMKALERSASARGNLLSGSTMKGIQRFGQDLASQEYTNAFNRYQVNRSNQLNPLQSMSGAGQTATNTMASDIGNASANSQGNITNQGVARASGYVGSANALSSALGSVGTSALQFGFNNMGNRNSMPTRGDIINSTNASVVSNPYRATIGGY
jgi:hypothetical protein